MRDTCYAVKDENGVYYCGLKKWDKQLRKAQLFHSFRWAKQIRDCPAYAGQGTRIVRIQIDEIDEYNPDEEI